MSVDYFRSHFGKWQEVEYMDEWVTAAVDRYGVLANQGTSILAATQDIGLSDDARRVLSAMARALQWNSSTPWSIAVIDAVNAPVINEDLTPAILEQVEMRCGIPRKMLPAALRIERLPDAFLAATNAITGWLAKSRERDREPDTPAPGPLTEAQQKVYDLIRAEGPLSGKEIVNRSGHVESESALTAHFIPALKRHGILNRRGLGYYHPGTYNPT